MGTVVWLSADFETLYERALRGGERPMLAGRSREEVEALYRSREPYYGQAHLMVDTRHLGPDQVAARVLHALEARARVGR
jgi:shikimate kinase